MSDYVVTSKDKAIPNKNLIKELFSPINLDNQDSTKNAWEDYLH